MNGKPPPPNVGASIQVLRADGALVAGEVMDVSDYGVCVGYPGLVGTEAKSREMPLVHWFLRSAAKSTGAAGTLYLDRLGASFTFPA